MPHPDIMVNVYGGPEDGAFLVVQDIEYDVVYLLSGAEYMLQNTPKGLKAVYQHG